ncbi:MAG TPA: primosomal protein N', partial [Rhodanobacteraceae bacterium]|nr:primosomal protein N' [Rhodanobacteraceae bacterium]
MNPILRVALDVPLDRLFDYLAPNDGEVAIGSRVLVPFGRREVVGIVVDRTGASELPPDRLKAAIRRLDEKPLLDAELLGTLQRAARYYQHPLGEVLHTALPAALRSPRALPVPGADALALTADGARAREAPGRRKNTRIAALIDLLAHAPCSMTDLDAALPGWRAAARAAIARGWVARVA